MGAEDRYVGGGVRALGAQQFGVEPVTELGGQRVRPAVEGGQRDEERLVAQGQRRLVLLEPLPHLALQRAQREGVQLVGGQAPGRVPGQRRGEGGGLAELVVAGEETGDGRQGQQAGRLAPGVLLARRRVRGGGAQVGVEVGGEHLGDRGRLPAGRVDLLQDGGGADRHHQVAVVRGEPVADGQQVRLAQRAGAVGHQVAQHVADRARGGRVLGPPLLGPPLLGALLLGIELRGQLGGRAVTEQGAYGGGAAGGAASARRYGGR
ncbi:hypothetical protein NQP46_13005 [Streptomyces albus]|nr:hypothetical protein NQP46_13005 [Streptomyces albus]